MILRKPHHKGFKLRLDRRRRLRAMGKKGKANKEANRALAKSFTGLHYCEARFPHECTGEHQLTWSHAAKRRKRPDLLHAALICVNAHNVIEVLPPEEMKRIVDEIVASRGDRELEAA